jgi:hypothetical protein
MAMPPPTPVPRRTPKTVSKSRPAPSIASERAKQLASLATRGGRARAGLEVGLQGAADEPGGVGVLDEAGGVGDDAGDADTDGALLASFGFQLSDEAGDGIEGGGVGAGGGDAAVGGGGGVEG